MPPKALAGICCFLQIKGAPATPEERRSVLDLNAWFKPLKNEILDDSICVPRTEDVRSRQDGGPANLVRGCQVFSVVDAGQDRGRKRSLMVRLAFHARMSRQDGALSYLLLPSNQIKGPPATLEERRSGLRSEPLHTLALAAEKKEILDDSACVPHAGGCSEQTRWFSRQSMQVKTGGNNLAAKVHCHLTLDHLYAYLW
ncbi:hypothetical protein ACLOJK_015586 [Asimina triloba]